MRRGPTAATLLGLGCLGLSNACGSKNDTTTEPSAAPAFGTVDAGEVDAGAPECSGDTKNPFVLSEDNGLYSFDPVANTLRLVGNLACATGGARPTSMAIDRKGFAWVRHTDGSLWKVNTTSLQCTATTYAAPADTEAFFKFGMGFSTASQGGSYEQLFLSDNAGAGLGRLDLTSFKRSFIGPYTGELVGKTCELTGTGDGKLYGFFVTTPAQIAEISKGTGDIVHADVLTGVVPGDAWAFSFYAGDFYVYTHVAPGSVPRADDGSDITRFRPRDGSITVVKPKVGFKIVGAGVSTCAPTTGPR